MRSEKANHESHSINHGRLNHFSPRENSPSNSVGSSGGVCSKFSLFVDLA